MKPLYSLLLVAALLVGVMIGVGITGRLEPFLEAILTVFAGPEGSRFYLVPVDFDPFDPCLWGPNSPHDLCV